MFTLTTLCLLLSGSGSAVTVPDSFVQSFDTKVSVSAIGIKTISEHLIIQVNNRNGEDVCTVQIGYGKGNRIKKLDARLLDLFGNEIRTLKKNEIVDRSSISNYSLYEDDFVRAFTLKHDKYPYVIEYSYEQEFDEYFSIAHWYAYDRNLKTKSASLTVELPKSLKINLYEYKTNNCTEIDLGNDRMLYSWSEINLEVIASETKGPRWYDLVPKVIMTPVDFVYGVTGQAATWQNYGDWLFRLAKNSNDLDASFTKQFESRLVAAHTLADTVRILYNAMQDEMHYVSVQIDVGGMKPYPASYVSKNKYGDCKALTYYMKSTLAAYDILAYPVDINLNGYHPIRTETPGPQFNHVFLCVPDGVDTIWLENTSSSLPFHYLSADVQSTKGLFIDLGRSQLINLPKMTFENVKSTTTIQFTLDGDDLNGEMYAHYRGEWFEYLVAIKKGWNTNDVDTRIKRYFPIAKSEVTHWQIYEEDRNEASIGFSAEFIMSMSIKTFGTAKAVFIPQYRFPELEKPDLRQYEYREHVPTYDIDTMRFVIDPKIYSDIKIPQDFHLTSDYGQYELTWQTESGLVQCIRTLQIKANTYQIGAAYQGYYDFIQKIKSTELTTYITLKP